MKNNTDEDHILVNSCRTPNPAVIIVLLVGCAVGGVLLVIMILVWLVILNQLRNQIYGHNYEYRVIF